LTWPRASAVERVAVNLSSHGSRRKCSLYCASRPPPYTAVSNQEPCIVFAVNHFSMSDRSQPPERCFGGKRPFLHHRKSVERLTPTTRTTSLVLMRASRPASRSIKGGRFGLPALGLGGPLTGGTKSTSGSCIGRSALGAVCRLWADIPGRARLEGRCISRGLVSALPCPLGAEAAPDDRLESFIA